MRTCVLVPCFKRPEYTAKCVDALEKAQLYPNAQFLLVDDGSLDDTARILLDAKLPKEVIIRDGNLGLRAALIEFIEHSIVNGFDLLGVIGNDCVVPAEWLNAIEAAFQTTDAEVLSPNVYPSNAAFKYGQEDAWGKGYRPSKIVGGLWFMRRQVAEGVGFENVEVSGITGAFDVLERILLEKEPRVGWLPNITVQDIGHWSGDHPEHIKSPEHAEYSKQVGRRTAW